MATRSPRREETLATEIEALGPDGSDPAELARLLGIVLQACDIVARLHARGACHGELSPHRLLLDRHGEVSVRGGRGLSTDEAPCLPYYSTEQAWGRSADIDARTDVYAFGGMLFAIMTLHGPHERAGDKGLELASARRGAVRPPQALCERELPSQLCRIAMRALAASPADRYPTILQLKQDLERFMCSLVTEEAPSQLGARSVSIQRASASLPASRCIEC